MGSSKKHKDKDKEHKRKHRHRSRSRSRSRERKHRDREGRGHRDREGDNEGRKRHRRDHSPPAESSERIAVKKEIGNGERCLIIDLYLFIHHRYLNISKAMMPKSTLSLMPLAVMPKFRLTPDFINNTYIQYLHLPLRP